MTTFLRLTTSEVGAQTVTPRAHSAAVAGLLNGKPNGLFDTADDTMSVVARVVSFARKKALATALTIAKDVSVSKSSAIMTFVIMSIQVRATGLHCCTLSFEIRLHLLCATVSLSPARSL